MSDAVEVVDGDFVLALLLVDDAEAEEYLIGLIEVETFEEGLESRTKDLDAKVPLSIRSTDEKASSA
jgi:hypothetical protein